MKLDCGYRTMTTPTQPGPMVRIFQAISLEGDVDAAKGLAWAAPQLREGIRRVEGTGLELTAIVEPLRAISGDGEAGVSHEASNEAIDRYGFGVEAMEREAIRVVTLSDLARVAETARLELGF
jgi:hypothetical protein